MKIPKLLMAVAICMICACGENVGAAKSGPGEATVTILDQVWTVSGNCERSGENLTFVAPGDPMLTIGINNTTGSNAVGNFNSVSEGFGVLIGTSPVAPPHVKLVDNAFTVIGTFTVLDGSTVDGTITVECDL